MLSESIQRYQNQISGPLLDRIDLHIDVPPLQATEKDRAVENLKPRTLKAQQQLQRQQCLNQVITKLIRHMPLDDSSTKIAIPTTSKSQLVLSMFTCRINRIFLRGMISVTFNEALSYQYQASDLSIAVLNFYEAHLSFLLFYGYFIG